MSTKKMNVKVIGAGSIGNHLAQAARRMGWSVVIVDKDPKALERTKNELYPNRYGAWDEAIKLCKLGQEPKGGFDIICIGTPPHVRMSLAIDALKEKPRVLQLEKPLCTPDLKGMEEFLKLLKKHPETKVVIGYDHAISQSITFVLSLLEKKAIGEVETVDVEFREHWQGIFKAHPWLSGPQDTYLGYSAKGGGASGEHSHALHLWQLLSRKSDLGRWEKVTSVMNKVKANGAEYDSIAAFLLTTDKGKVGRVVQDVVTLPVRKIARIQGKNGFIEWICGGSPEGDLVRYQLGQKPIQEKVFKKKRPDDFFEEMKHIKQIMDGKISAKDSPISLQSAVEVMKVLKTSSKAKTSKIA